MLDFTACHMSYLDNIFRQHGSILYEKSPESIKCWQGVLETLEKHQNKACANDLLIVGDAETTVSFIRELDNYIANHIYDLTEIDKDFGVHWRIVKDALERYVFDLKSA